MRNYALDVQLRELMVQHGHHEGEHQQRRQRPDPAPEGTLVLLGRRCSWTHVGALPLCLTRERLVADAVRLRGVLALTALVVLGVVLVVTLEPDHLRVSLE